MKKFTVRFRETIYERIKKYAVQEEITVMAAIRQIITQFFKDKK
jgi:hypothetical protein